MWGSGDLGSEVCGPCLFFRYEGSQQGFDRTPKDRLDLPYKPIEPVESPIPVQHSPPWL